LQQAVEQDPNLTAEEKKHRRHKIEEEIAAGLGVAALGYEVRCTKKFHKMHQVVTNFLQHSKLLLKHCC
jgi:hypothetical protein